MTDRVLTVIGRIERTRKRLVARHDGMTGVSRAYVRSYRGVTGKEASPPHVVLMYVETLTRHPVTESSYAAVRFHKKSDDGLFFDPSLPVIPSFDGCADETAAVVPGIALKSVRQLASGCELRTVA